MIETNVCAWKMVGRLAGAAIRNTVRANMFYISSSSDANACRSVRESSRDFPAFSFFEEGGL